MQNTVVSFNPGQTAAYLNCKSKYFSLPWFSIADITSMENLTNKTEGILHDTLSQKSLQKIDMKEGKIPAPRGQ